MDTPTQDDPSPTSDYLITIKSKNDLSWQGYLAPLGVITRKKIHAARFSEGDAVGTCAVLNVDNPGVDCTPVKQAARRGK